MVRHMDHVWTRQTCIEIESFVASIGRGEFLIVEVDVDTISVLWVGWAAAEIQTVVRKRFSVNLVLSDGQQCVGINAVIQNNSMHVSSFVAETEFDRVKLNNVVA